MKRLVETAVLYPRAIGNRADPWEIEQFVGRSPVGSSAELAPVPGVIKALLRAVIVSDSRFGALSAAADCWKFLMRSVSAASLPLEVIYVGAPTTYIEITAGPDFYLGASCRWRRSPKADLIETGEEST